MKPRSVCLIAGGFSRGKSRLQPWRYLLQVARGLAARGHPVVLVSDGEVGLDSAEGFQVRRLASIRNLPWCGNKNLQSVISQSQPEVIILHSGLTSSLHQDFNISANLKSVGVFTSPIYSSRDLIRLGPGRLLRNLPLTGAHLVGSCLPDRFVRARFKRSRFDAWVVQTQTTRRQLQDLGLNSLPVVVIPPGVDPDWSRSGAAGSPPFSCSTSSDEVTLIYFGPAEQLRGLYTLVEAFGLARRQDSTLRLQILVRRDQDSHPGKMVNLERKIAGFPGNVIQVQAQSLSLGDLAARLAAVDVVALPFELVSSDAPLSLIEAVALGKPVVTTPLACLPELAAPVPHFFARPGDPGSLASALLQAAEHVRSARARSKRSVLPPSPPVRAWATVGEEWSHLIQSL